MFHRWSLPSRSPKQFDDQKYEETIDLIQQVVCSPGATCHFGKTLLKLNCHKKIKKGHLLCDLGKIYALFFFLQSLECLSSNYLIITYMLESKSL